MAKSRTKSKVVKTLGCAVLASVCALSAINVMSFSVRAEASGYEGHTYDLEAKSRQDSLERANKFNETIAEEGFVLLQNKNNALPLASSVKKLNLLGKNWSNPAFGGGGSSSFSTSSGDGIDGYTSIKNAGYTINNKLKTFYDDDKASGGKRPQYQYQAADMITAETPQSKYSEELKNSLSDFDASVVMVSRTGGEGIDVSDFFFGNAVEGRSGDLTGQHYLQLDDNEKALINLAREKAGTTKKVILVLNAAQPLEFEDAILEKVDAVLWIGLPGSTGFAALGRILNGEVNPSGRTVDLYAKDFNTIPSVQNFASNKKTVEYNDPTSSCPSFSGIKSPAGDALLKADGSPSTGNGVTYEEGIYVGYKYFETRAFEEDKKTGATADKWYKDNVRYPFGYGLSYTTFEYTNVEFKVPETLNKDSEIEVEVTVKNTGDVAGKEVVQLYYSAPYTAGKIEKAHVNLGDFAKTPLLQPKASATVTMKISLESMASYDWDDANENKFKGYELDAGKYNLFVSSDSHGWYNAPDAQKKEFTLADGIKYEMNVDNKTYGANDVHSDNQFDDISAGIMDRGIDEMTREDFASTFPQKPTEADRTVDAAFEAKLAFGVTSDTDPTGAAYDKDQPWFVADANKPTQRTTPLTGDKTVDKVDVIRLSSLQGVDPYGTAEEKAKWDKFLDQFTPQQLMDFVENGKFRSQKFDVLGIPEGIHPDGPFGFVGQINGYGSARCYYVSPCIVAATFNKELVEEQGEHIGEEGAWMGYNGLYGPGVNIHRTPFSGRNFEYYSEDGFLSGIMAAYLTKGMQSKGVFPFLKHFALNDQETNRNAITTWATEQAMREIYLKAFQLAIDVDATSLFDDEAYVGHKGALGVMSSFNRVGTTWAGASYPLLTNVLRKEWGFKGIVVTDWYNGGYMDQEQMVRAGNDLSLGNDVGSTGSKNITAAYQKHGEKMLTATLLTALRNAARNLSYATLNSCNMSKLTDYQSTTTLGEQYLMFSDMNDLSIDFSSELFEAEFEGLTYELTLSDKLTSHATRPTKLPADINAEIEGDKNTHSAIIDPETGLVTVHIEGSTAAEYQVTVSVKNAAGKFIGQSATVTVRYMGKDTFAAMGDMLSEIEALQTQSAAADKKIADLTKKLTDLEGAAATKDELAAEVKTLTDALEAAKTEAAETKTALEAKITALETAMKALEEKHAKEIKELQDKLAELEKAQGESNTRIEELEKSGCGSTIDVFGTTLFCGLGLTVLAAAVIIARKSRKTDK